MINGVYSGICFLRYLLLFSCCYYCCCLAFTPIPPVVFSPANYTFLVPEDSPIGTMIGQINPITQEDTLPALTFSYIGTTMVSVGSNYYVELTEAAPDYENIPSGTLATESYYWYSTFIQIIVIRPNSVPDPNRLHIPNSQLRIDNTHNYLHNRSQ